MYTLLSAGSADVSSQRANIRAAVESNLEKDVTERIRYFTLEELLGFLDEEEANAAGNEQIVRGYKVKVKYRPLDEAERKAKRQAIAQTILQAMRRMRDK